MALLVGSQPGFELFEDGDGFALPLSLAFFDAGLFEALLDLVEALDVGQGFGRGAGMLIAGIGKVTPCMVPTRYGSDAFMP